MYVGLEPTKSINKITEEKFSKKRRTNLAG
jgi:hypothetical protein